MHIKNLPAAKNRARELEKQARLLQAKIYDFVEELNSANLYKQSQLASDAGFEMDETQFKLQAIFR